MVLQLDSSLFKESYAAALTASAMNKGFQVRIVEEASNRRYYPSGCGVGDR